MAEPSGETIEAKNAVQPSQVSPAIYDIALASLQNIFGNSKKVGELATWLHG